LKDNLVDEFHRHRYIIPKISGALNKALFEKLSSGEGTRDDYAKSLKFLCQCLYDYHGQKAIILLDEYDVPLEGSWFGGFYNEIIAFIRPLLSSALKDNPFLNFAVITGCLRISKESIFTGLNNPAMVSILTKEYSEYFGFTQSEIDAMLAHYGLMSKRQTLEDWYNGYLFGNTVVYNPWSSILVVNSWLSYIDEFPKPYWANTSSNDIIRKLIELADDDVKIDLETLMSDGTISKKIHEDITYDEIDKNADNLWNFLFFTGYLKKVNERLEDDVTKVLDLSIPNLELLYIYERKINEWFNERVAEKNLSALYNAILNKDVTTFQSELSTLLRESISFMDSAENFYHGFMCGVLSRLKGFLVKSNRETGKGRSDVVMFAVSRRDKVVIFELKPAKKFLDLPAVCEDALKQIEVNNYAAEWYEEGYSDIIKYGIGFYRKDCMVVIDS
jgi:hypothetical protein